MKKEGHNGKSSLKRIHQLGVTWKTKKPRSTHSCTSCPKENMILNEVSTVLCLSTDMKDASFSTLYTKKRKEMKQAEKEKEVCTELTLFTDPWKIKKVLSVTDLNQHQNRFLFPKELARLHVHSFMTLESFNKISTDKGLDVEVYDEDTESSHAMIFKYWKSSRTCVLINGWSHDFVKRRNLKEGDEVGLYLHPYTSKFSFTVLKRQGAA